MLRISGFMLAATLATGFVSAPTASWAEQGAKPKAAKSSESSKASAADEFEENRRAHMAKSKENNTKKTGE